MQTDPDAQTVECSPGGTRRCVILFARSPRQEEGAKHIDRSRRLFALLRARARRAVRAVGVDLVEIGGAGIPQRGTTFGERLTNAIGDVRALGYREIVIIPIDVPGLAARDLAAAFEALAGHDHVIGPSPDGGVYLIGSRCDPSALLAAVPWNSGDVFKVLAARGDVAVLRRLRDVDTAADLLLVLDDPLAPAVRLCVQMLVAGRPVPRDAGRRHAELGARRGARGRAPPLAS